MNTIHLTVALDSKYTRFAGVLFVSVLENNLHEHVCFHVMGLNLSQENKLDLVDIVERYGKEIVFYDMDKKMFESFPVSAQWNYAVYFRLILPNMLPASIQRIIYLDCDITCRGPIRELYDVDLKGNIVGACEDHVLSPRMGLCYLNKVYAENFYFNSGMLLIDCEAWRKNNITEKCIDYLKNEHPMHFDQDTLNSVLQGKWLHLPYRWNFMADFHGAYFGQREFDMDMKKTYPYYPVLIHFTGVKPWNHANRSVYKADYYRYQSLTKWGGIIPKHTLPEMLLNMVRGLLDKTKIRRKVPFKRYDFDFRND